MANSLAAAARFRAMRRPGLPIPLRWCHHRLVTDEKRTVLVIDDEESVRDVLYRYLSKAGYQVKAAADGEEALQLVYSGSPPDLIILDLMMPVMSGFEVLSALRTHPSWRSIPVLVLTATMGYSPAHLHADGLVQKPFDLPTVKAAVDVALQKRATVKPN